MLNYLKEKLNLNKLITKEDPNYLHKFLGIFSLGNYIYRYYLLIFYGSMFLNTKLDLGIIALHGCLSISSLIFHIPQKRHIKLPMIYPEFRLHSIAFGLRSVSCCFLDYYGGKYKLYAKMWICILTMIAADIITKKKAQKDDSTMRAMPYDEKTPENDKKNITQFHSNQQIGATLFMLLNIDSAFSPLFAIQFAAFLMTLVRKNIIKANTWHLLYSWSLLINIFVLKTIPVSLSLKIMILGFCFKYLRIKMRINKYLAWSIIFSAFSILDLTRIDKYLETNENLNLNQNIITNGMCMIYLIKNLYTTRKLY
jgi:hypothetical protein